MFRFLLFLTVVCFAFSLDAVSAWLPEPHHYKRAEVIGVSEICVPVGGTVVAPGTLFLERSLNGTWKCSGLTASAVPFDTDPGAEMIFADLDFDDSKWDDIAVPLNWYRKYTAIPDPEKPYVKGWYRTEFTLGPEALDGRRVILRFGVIGYEAELFLNGRPIGSHHGDFTAFELDATDAARSGVNTLAIRVRSDFGPVFGVRGAVSHTYGSQWAIDNIKGGIWQDAALRLEPEFRIFDILIDPVFSEKKLEVRAVILNPTGKTVELELTGTVSSALKSNANALAGTVAPLRLRLEPGRNPVEFSVPVPDIEPWGLGVPKLYFLTLTVVRNGAAVSAAVERFGFREFRERDGKFFLNGEEIYLFGENLSALAYGGWGSSTEKEEDKLEKSILEFMNQGYVLLRNAHMPMVSAAARVADECGMLFFDEWGWAFTTRLDLEKFARVNGRELEEFIRRDYNHPSVVMWSLGNEVIHRNNPPIQKLLDAQVAAVRRLDRSKRPVSSFSGSGNWRNYGDAKLDTDVLDLHTYVGMSRPWTLRNEEADQLYEGWKRIYGDDTPALIAWENVGFSWGFELNAHFRVGDVEEYARYAARSFDWANPRGIGLSGTLGLAAALDPARASGYAQALYGKRIAELYRLDSRFAGFAPWFQNSRLPMSRLWNQPIFPSLRNDSWLPPRHLFFGKNSDWTLTVVNDGSERLDNPVLELELVDSDGNRVPAAVEKLNSIVPHSRFTCSLTFAPPAGIVGQWQLRLTLREQDGRELGRNYYDLYLRSPESVTQKIDAVRPVFLYDTKVAGNMEAAAGFLRDCGVPFQICTPAQLGEPGLLIVPPELKESQVVNLLDDPKLADWINNGGILLVFEQRNPESRFPGNLRLREAGNTFVDLVTPDHPFFAGLAPLQFDTWNNPGAGFVVGYSFSPYIINALAVNGPMESRSELDGVLIEAIAGAGRIVLSQFETFRSADHDSAAATYRHNVLKTLAGVRTLPPGPLPLVAMIGGNYEVVPERLVKIDLSEFANRSFSDEHDNDGLGGWTDQGANNFSTVPTGAVSAAGIGFRIIDPAGNNGKSCLILRGTDRPKFPEAIRNIRIGGKFSRLFFLHTSAWGRDAESGRYRIRYADGKSTDFILQGGRNIGDWWSWGRLPEAKRGISFENPVGAPVVAYVAAWENLRPDVEIVAIDFLSVGAARGDAIDFLPVKAPVPILIAVSGEMSHPASLEPIGKAYRAALPCSQLGSSATGKVRELPRATHKALELSFSEILDNQIPAVMIQYHTAGTAADYHYLTFEAAASRSSIIQLEFPEKNWKSRYRATLMLNGDGKMHRYRLGIGKELKFVGREFGFDEMRGELFVFHPPQPGSSGKSPALKLTIERMRFE